MNLTMLDSQPKQKLTADLNSAPLSSNNRQVQSSVRLPPKQNQKQTVQPNCTASIFSACVDSKQADNSDMDEIQLKGKIITKKNHLDSSDEYKHKWKSSSRHKKLSLSRNSSKQSHQINATPTRNKKQTAQNQPLLHSNKLYSEQRNKNGAQSHIKVQKINVYLAKSQPRKDYSETVTSLPIKQQIKFSPNIGSSNINTIKKEDDSARKTKLTLSNSFKSQIQDHKQINQTVSEFKPSLVSQSIPQTAKSQSVMIEQSFMTARLKNIYGDTSHIQDLYNLSSNMAFYQTLTGGSRQLMAGLRNSQNTSEPEVEKYRSHDNSANYSSSSLHQQQQQNMNKIIEQNQHNTDAVNQLYTMQPQDKQRRGIGSYAKTIKTFNQSDERSEEESVVIQHLRNQGGFIACLPLNRGSIKEDSGEDVLQMYRRRYSSLGEDSAEGVSAFKDKFSRYVHQPIQEDENDEERQL